MPGPFLSGTPWRVSLFYNLNADRFIGGHSDISKHEVAAALLASVAVT